MEITLPCLLPKRKQRQSTEFLIDPIYFTLSQYADSHVLPKFEHCVVCFSHIYSQELPLRRVRDYDNLELKQLLDVISTFVMEDDTGSYVMPTTPRKSVKMTVPVSRSWIKTAFGMAEKEGKKSQIHIGF